MVLLSFLNSHQSSGRGCAFDPRLTAPPTPTYPTQVSVRCWPEGRILIQGDPDLSCAGSAQRVQEELQLPLVAGQKLLPRTAQALFTDTGRLYVKVEATHPTSQGSHFATLTPGPSAEQPAAY